MVFLLQNLLCSLLVDPAGGPGLPGPYTEQVANRENSRSSQASLLIWKRDRGQAVASPRRAEA